MSSSVTESHVSANPGADMPVQLQCKSSMGTYSLICSMTSISLYNVEEERYVWRQQIT